jgi:hypothetical protein
MEKKRLDPCRDMTAGSASSVNVADAAVTHAPRQNTECVKQTRDDTTCFSSQ